MQTKLISNIKKHSILFLIGMVVLLILASASLNFYSRYLVMRHSDIMKEIQVIRQGLKDMNRFVNMADLGLRGYMIKQDDQFLSPYTEAQEDYQANLDRLKVHLVQQQYENMTMFTEAQETIQTYMELLENMVQLTDQKRTQELLNIFEEDRGYDAWMSYSKFEEDVEAFEKNLEEASTQSYYQALTAVLIIQLLLIGVGVPTLLFVVLRIRRDQAQRHQLFTQLDHSNRNYIFDDHKTIKVEDESSIIHELTSNLEKAAIFIKQVAQGNYEVDWEGLTEKNQSYNQGNLAGELIQMREQMKEVKREDEQRLWMTEGEGRVAEITRVHQTDLTALGDQLVAYIVKYLKANQGGLFILDENDESEKHLALIACYAYDKKKYEEKTIKIGQGLVGQAFLEQKTIRMNQIPDNYVRITSGLGEATPTYLAIVPLKFNEEVLGVLEIASFRQLDAFEIDFLEKTGEIIASSISIVRTNARTQTLLAQAKEQTEEMRAQEEEMRQNMEEMQATQEQHERLQQELQENERLLKEKLLELEAAKAKFEKREQELVEQLQAVQK